MSKYSRIYKIKRRRFRYNYERCVIELIAKADKEMLKDNEEWIEKHGQPLWDIEGGYTILDSIGCFLEDWKESPEGMCEMWSFDLDEEVEFMMSCL
jgi:hypothetical protein